MIIVAITAAIIMGIVLTLTLRILFPILATIIMIPQLNFLTGPLDQSFLVLSLSPAVLMESIKEEERKIKWKLLNGTILLMK